MRQQLCRGGTREKADGSVFSGSVTRSIGLISRWVVEAKDKLLHGVRTPLTIGTGRGPLFLLYGPLSVPLLLYARRAFN